MLRLSLALFNKDIKEYVRCQEASVLQKAYMNAIRRVLPGELVLNCNAPAPGRRQL